VRYLLDTCFISELIKPRPSRAVATWLAEQHEEDLYLSVLTLGEIQNGIARLQDGRKKARLQSWLDHDLRDRFRGRITGITEEAAIEWGRISGESRRRGRPLPVVDALLAASAIAIDATVVTRDEAGIHAAGAKTFSPWNA
jgi:hypothetical protein